MLSREIAELVKSRHDSVKRTIERLAAKNIIQLTPMVEVKNNQGQIVQEYKLFKRDTYVVVAQLCPEFTARLVDRWQELEDAVSIQKPINVSDGLPEYRKAKAIEMTTKAIGKIFSDLPHLSGLSKQAIYANTINPIAGTIIIPQPVLGEKPIQPQRQTICLASVQIRFGNTANYLGLKTPEYGHYILDKSRHSDKQVEAFRYNQKGRDALLAELGNGYKGEMPWNIYSPMSNMKK